MTEFPRVTNGTIKCPACGGICMVSQTQCGSCKTVNLLSHIELDILTNIPEEEYDHKIEEILNEKGINIKEELNNIEEKKEESLDKNFPNAHVKWGIFFTVISLLVGDILKIIGGGFIFQQTALSIGFGMFGLGLILCGSFKLVILKLDKLIDDKDSE